MKIFNVKNYKGGWFIGNFEPTLLKTNEFEIAVKEYVAGCEENAHYHAIATEFTVIVNGLVEINGVKYGEGDIILVEPNEIIKFKALTDCKTLVIKMPSVLNDKYIVEK